MTHTVLPPSPPASTARRTDLLFAVVAGSGVVALTLLIAVGWWGFSQLSGSAAGGTVTAFSGSTARGYAAQLAKVELPGSYEVIKRKHGGTYVAAGNGPYASISYRTSESLNSAVARVQQAMEQAGYTVRTSLDDSPFFKDVTRLDGTATGRDIEALIGVREVYDQPFGYIAPVPGTTGVLLVVEDHGRSR